MFVNSFFLYIWCFMKINSLNSNNVSNKLQKDVSTKKDTNIVQSENAKVPYNVAFYGLFVKKPLDGSMLFESVQMRPNEEYQVNNDSTFFLNNKFVDLSDKEISESIENLQPNQRLFIDNKEMNPLSDDYLSIRKDAKGKLFASAFCKGGIAQILPNIFKLNTQQESLKLDPTKYYEIPMNSVLDLGGIKVDLTDYQDKLSALNNGEKLIIGRSEESDIIIEEDYVSRSHCSIEKRANKYLIKDLNSMNGTKFLEISNVNSSEGGDIYTLEKGVPTKVDRNSQLYLGYDFAIDLRNKNILDLLYKKGEITVGRSDDCDLVVPDFYDQVSRNHLSIAMKDNQIYVTDLNSTNSTQVIPKNKIKPFYQGVENLELSQGNIGDCYLLSSLYALSKNPQGQKLIEKMVKVDDEGNYIVTFYGKAPIKVPLEQLDGQKLDGKEKICVKGELGLRAIERAYGKMLNQFRDIDRTLFMDIDKGGKISETLFKLTGRSSKNYYIPHINVNQKFAELSQKPKDSFVMLCGSHQKGQYGGYVDPQKKFIERHAYTIKNFDVYNQMVEIVNPHNTTKSEFIHFNDFQQMFDFMYVLDI